MDILRFTVLIVVILISPSVCFAADSRCHALFKKLDLEEEAAKNLAARERAAIADLKPPRELEEMREKYMAGRLSPDTYNAERKKWDRGLDCINAEAELKYSRIGYDSEAKYKDAGCQREPIAAWKVESVKERTNRKSEACGKADIEYLAGMVKRLGAIKADKLANEEPQTPVIKQADLSARNTEFCRVLRSVADNASSAFKAIAGRRNDRKFADTIAISEMVGVDSFSTPVTLSLDFVGAIPKCSIDIGNEHEPNLALRSVPSFTCTWNYEQTTRRELDERADKIANISRGCFQAVSESPGETFRHSFTADGRIELYVTSYYGEKRPSHLSLSVERYLPQAFAACMKYSVDKDPRAKQLCLQRWER